MPRNAQGVYILPSGNPVVPGTIIDTDWANPTMSDLGTEMQDSLSRSGKGGMLAPLRAIDGTEGAPAYTFINELLTGMYRAGASDLRLTAGGQDIIRVTPAGGFVHSQTAIAKLHWKCFAEAMWTT